MKKKAVSAVSRPSRLAVSFLLAGITLIPSPGFPAPRQGKAAAQSLAKRFQAALDDLRARYNFPGATAAYVLADGTVGVAASGVADHETGAPMTPRSRMPAASIGKTFVAATAAMMAFEGALDLDAPLSRWLGDRAWFARLPNHEAITLRHLLNHAAGLPDHVYSRSFAAEFSRKWSQSGNPFRPEDLIGFILDQPPLFPPGKGWFYSDTGYILAGLAIEKAAGRSYYDEVGRRFLVPLGLKMTSPADRRSLPGLAAGYMSRENDFGLPARTTRADGSLAWHPGVEWTGGGLVSTAGDLASWGFFLFTGKAVPAACLDEILKAVPVRQESDDVQYGLGVAIHRNGPHGTVYGHGGWIPGYCSNLCYYKDHGVALAYQLNTDIGIADHSTPLMDDMEARLAGVVLTGK